MIPSSSYFFYSKIRLFRLSTSAPMDIHIVRVPQDVDVVGMSGESQRNEENVPHFFRSMLTAMGYVLF